MKAIEERYLQRLKTAGLFICPPFPDEHPWEHGVRVGKPTTTAGNSIPNYETAFEGVDIDAPSVVLYSDGQYWHVYAQDHTPTPGPGDFKNQWSTPDEAVDDILDLFLGDPERMSRKAAAKEAVRKRSAEYQSKLAGNAE